MANEQIILHDVRKSFGSTHAVRGVSFSVLKNEFVTLLGPSGCGKTTLLRLIGGLERSDGGSILVDGQPVETTLPRARRTRMVFQQYALFPHMTVGQNVEFGLRVRNMPRAERQARARDALAMVQLADKIDSKPGQLSGGQQQRVALARAIVTEPSVLLLDEPLAALDLQLRKAMQIELKSLQQRLGITFIYVTHDQTEALTMSDRIVVMSHGRVEQIGDGRTIYDRPATPFVAQFVGEANYFSGEVQSVDAGTVVIRIDGEDFSFPKPSEVSLATGTAAAFIVRPERMNWSATRTAGPSLACTVNQVLHLGSVTRLLLTTAASRRLTIDMLESQEPRIGDSVFAAWSSDAMRWLAAE